MIIIPPKGGLGNGCFVLQRKVKVHSVWSGFCLFKLFDSVKLQLTRTPIGRDSEEEVAGLLATNQFSDLQLITHPSQTSVSSSVKQRS